MDSKEHIEAYLVSLRELTENLADQSYSAVDLAQYLHTAAESLATKWPVFQNYRLLPHPLSDSLTPTRNQLPKATDLEMAVSSGELWNIPVALNFHSVADSTQVLGIYEFSLTDERADSLNRDTLWEVIQLWANSVGRSWQQQVSSIRSTSLSENQDLAIKRLQVFEGVFDVMHAIATKPATAEILTYACENIVKSMDGVDRAGIVFNDNAPESGTVVAEYPIQGGVGQKLQLEGTRIYELLTETSAPVVINDLEKADELGDNREILMGFGIKALMVLPLIVNDELIGSLGIDAVEAVHTFTQDEVDVMIAVASQLAVGMLNNQFVATLQKQSETQRLINQVLEKLPLRSDLETLLRRTGDTLGQLLGASRYSIHLNIPEEFPSEIIQNVGTKSVGTE
jgi:GAF domain-containing protein